jgi:hypothetical protein
VTGRRLLRLPEKPVEGFIHGYSLSSWLPVRLMDLVAQVPERVLLWPFYRRIPIDHPIFVVGAFRSGTTILERIIAGHPGVGHFWFFTNVSSRAPVTGYGTVCLLQTLGILDRDGVPIIYNPRITTTLFSPYECEWVWSHSKRSLWDERCTDLTMGADFSDPPFERYLFSLIRRHLWLQHATRFVNKNPVNCLRMGYLHRLFPDARFVYIVRDPLDTLVSHYCTAARVERAIYADARIRRIFEDGLRMIVLTKRIKTRTYAQTLTLDRVHPLLGIANQWKDLQAAVLESIAHAPCLAGQVLTLHYEELVSQPAAVLERVWEFVGLRDEQAAAITRVYAPCLTPPPSPKLSAEERRLLFQAQEIVAPVAKQLGY